MIKMDPYYAGSHFALALVHQHAGSPDAARREFDEAARAWQHADSGMPEYAEALKSVGSE